MVTSIGSSSITTNVGFSSISNANTEKASYTNDVIKIGADFSNETIFDLFSRAKIDSIDSFKTEYQTLAGLPSDDNSVNYEGLYSDYMKYRGCSNEEDLKALNSVTDSDCQTMDDLKLAVKMKMMSALLILSAAGINTKDILNNMDKVVESATTQQLADFSNQCDMAQNSSNPNEGMLSALKCFFTSVSKNEGIDKDLKEKLIGLVKKINNTGGLEDILLQRFSDKTSEFNKKLIANYKE